MAPSQAVISLMEMGFDEKEVMDALRVSNNQQSAAVSTGAGAAGAPRVGRLLGGSQAGRCFTFKVRRGRF